MRCGMGREVFVDYFLKHTKLRNRGNPICSYAN